MRWLVSSASSSSRYFVTLQEVQHSRPRHAAAGHHRAPAPDSMPISSGTIKFINSLRQKKARQKYRKFTVEGPRAVGELLRQDRYRIDHLYALSDWADNAKPPPDVPLTVVGSKDLGRVSQLTTAHQVVAVVDMPPAAEALPTAMEAGFSLYLDGVQSPSNLGALLRVADWFGLAAVVGGPGTADLYNAKSLQASMGSFLRVPYHEATLDDIVSAFPTLPTVAADLEGDSIFDRPLPVPGLLVVGREGRGLSEGARTRVQRLVTIPKAAGSEAESLNVAVATGIIVGSGLQTSFN